MGVGWKVFVPGGDRRMTLRGNRLTVHPELAAEQAHVDRAYARLEEIQGLSAAVVSEPEGGGTHQSRFESAAATEFAARRARDLRFGRTPLVFGRTDATAGEAWYIGRAG